MSAASCRVLALAILITGLLRSAPGRCDPLSSAEAAFAEGRLALTQGEPARARAHFEASYRLEPAVGTLLNLAVCEEQLGLLVSALARLEEAKRRAPPGDKRVPSIEARIAALAARIPSLTLRFRNGDAGVHVTLDSRPVAPASLGTPLRVDPGTRTVTCSRAGERVCAERITVSEGQAAEVWLDVPPTEAGRPSAAAAASFPQAVKKPSARHRPEKTYGYVAGGIGISALALGIVASARILHYKDVMSRHCDASGCDAEGVEASDSGQVWSYVGTIGTAVGVVGLGTAAWILVIAEPTSASSAQVMAGGRF